MIARVEPPPSPEKWEKECREASDPNLRKLKSHAIEMLSVDYQAWNVLVGIAERVMRDRGIDF
jgi:hypothetical protein